MKLTSILSVLMLVLILSACAPAATPSPAASPPSATAILATTTPLTQVTLASTGADAAQQAAAVVQGLGTKLQLVSLLSPTAAADIRAQYAGYVSPDLLAQWAADPSQAPGRVTSSPWPDHIEITSMSNPSPNEVKVTGNIIEVTSVEVNTGGAAAKIPVEIILNKNAQSSWWITGWKQGS